MDDNKQVLDGGAEESTLLSTNSSNTYIDENSPKQTARLSKLAFNQEQEDQVRKLLEGDLQKATENLKDEVKKEGQEIKKDFLTIFGLFASFVTFLSIEVQVFKNKENLFELLGICSLSLAFVMFFALIINDIAKDKSSWSDFKKPTYFMNLLFAVIGVVFLFIGGASNESRLDILEKKLKENNSLVDSQRLGIINLTRKIERLDSMSNVWLKKTLENINNSKSKK